LAVSFSPLDFDVWNATLKRSTNPSISRSTPDARDPTIQTQTSPAGLTATSDLQSQPSNISPRLSPGNRLTESKAHHRQTSIVHGIQHSRNGSFSSSSNSPLSPQIIAAAGGERLDAFNMGDSPFAPPLPSMTSGASFSSSTTLVPERASTAAENSNYMLTQKRVERMHSGRSSRDHRHHHSHSRHHHKEELKTVGEYALHVLFTSVSLFKLYPSQTS
jgi:hypothetical protein